jgi:hypothetical protein
MASTINASSDGIIETADNTGVLQLQTNSLLAVNIDGSQNVTIPSNLTVNGTFTAPGISVVIKEEYQTATQGQTVFSLNTFTYVKGNNSLFVYINGSKQIVNLNYTETSTSVVTFSTGLNLNDIVEFVYI